MRIIGKVIIVIFCIFVVSALAAKEKLGRPSVELDFDELSVGEQLGTQYAALGVVFEGTVVGDLTAGYIGTDGDFGTFFFGNSIPNFAIIGGASLTAIFIDEATQQLSPVSDVSIRIGDGDVAGETFAVTAFDQEGNVLDSQVIQVFEDGATINIPKQDITHVTIFSIQGCGGCSSGLAIDDFKFAN